MVHVKKWKRNRAMKKQIGGALTLHLTEFGLQIWPTNLSQKQAHHIRPLHGLVLFIFLIDAQRSQHRTGQDSILF